MTLRSSGSSGLWVDPFSIAIDADDDLLAADRNAVGVSDNLLDGPLQGEGAGDAKGKT